jgi:ABC-type lipoprotein release transport system permease subunit
VSSVSLLSIGGIGLGVAALVVAMGLLSGYRGEIREKLIGANAEVVLFPLSTSAEADPEAAMRRVARVSRVRATAPVVYQSGLASSAATPDGTDVVLKGIDPASERRVSRLDPRAFDSTSMRSAATSRPCSTSSGPWPATSCWVGCLSRTIWASSASASAVWQPEGTAGPAAGEDVSA